jgi:hypothetical protein
MQIDKAHRSRTRRQVWDHCFFVMWVAASHRPSQSANSLASSATSALSDFGSASVLAGAERRHCDSNSPVCGTLPQRKDARDGETLASLCDDLLRCCLVFNPGGRDEPFSKRAPITRPEHSGCMLKKRKWPAHMPKWRSGPRWRVRKSKNARTNPSINAAASKVDTGPDRPPS